MVRLGRSPRSKFGRCPLRHGLPRSCVVQIPDANLAHHVSSRQVRAVCGKRATENRRRVPKGRNQVSTARIKHFHRRLGFRCWLVLPATWNVLSRGSRNPRSIRRKRHFPAPKTMRFQSAPTTTTCKIVPQKHPVVPCRNQSLIIGQQHATTRVRLMRPFECFGLARRDVHRIHAAIHARSECARTIRSEVETENTRSKFMVVSESKLHGSRKQFANRRGLVFNAMKRRHSGEIILAVGINPQRSEDRSKQVLFVIRLF